MFNELVLTTALWPLTSVSWRVGAEAEGYPAVTHGMFPRGGAELISFFYSTSNKRLGTILAEKVQSLEEEE